MQSRKEETLSRIIKTISELSERVNAAVIDFLGVNAASIEVSPSIVDGVVEQAQVSVGLPQSRYRPIDGISRLKLLQAIHDVFLGVCRREFDVELGDGLILSGDFQGRSRFDIEIVIRNDEAGRPDEMPPHISISLETSSHAAPLVALFSEGSLDVANLVSGKKRSYSLVSRFLPLLVDEPFWISSIGYARRSGADESYGMDFANEDCMLSILEAMCNSKWGAGRDWLRQRSWRAALAIANAIDNFHRTHLKRAEWLKQNHGVEFKLGDSDRWVKSWQIDFDQNYHQMVLSQICAKAVGGFQARDAISGGWDFETLACVKRLRSLSLGIMVGYRMLDLPPSVMMEKAIKYGDGINATAEWPI